MPTNASKHTVSFSDLAWDSVNVHENQKTSPGVATFPEAHQVGKYLQAYAEAYIPSESIRLGREVTNIFYAERVNPEWKVTSRALTENNGGIVEDFDHVIVASGFFNSPIMPELPGLEHFQGPVIHSSQLRDIDNLIAKTTNGKNIVVIGGSMSAGEASAILAYHISSLRHSPGTQLFGDDQLTVHHITPRPFWSVPPYVPTDPIADKSFNPRPTFLPLDLILADLGRRPGDQIRFAPSSTFSPDAAKMFNGALHSLLGSDQSGLGDGALIVPQSRFDKPPWLIISTSHAESVRSGQIKIALGRATAVHDNTIVVQTEDGEVVEMRDVGMIVMATGFTPHPALSFLSSVVRETLEHDLTNHYEPIRLSNFGTMNPSIPSLGFVGFYRGPYFGTIEQQARFLGALWSDSLREVPNESPASIDDMEQRGQYPMGDYVGLMESFSEILGTRRISLSSKHSPREGPAIPARYPAMHTNKSPFADSERAKACEAAVRALSQPSLFVAPAAFRALQGQWKVTREITSARPSYPSGVFTGEASMHPRYPTDEGYAAEFLYVEKGELVTSQGLHMSGSRSYVYRLSKLEPQAITVWFVKLDNGSREVDYLFHEIEFDHKSGEGGQNDHVSGWRAKGSPHLCIADHYDTEYWFKFHAIEMKEWGIIYSVKGPEKDYRTHATYVR